MDFRALLHDFTTAIVAADGERLASLFTEDGVYDDYFFGPHRGRDAIRTMLARFYEGGEAFRWDFTDPIADASGGYARYRFSYRSRVPESSGRIIVFEGIGHFVFDGGRIARYGEVFDRGLALTSLGFEPERVARILGRYAEALRGDPASRVHLDRR